MGRNVSKLYYPFKQAIESILPICDEFIIALGEGDEDDRTREEIESIGSPKIKIINTEWDLKKFPRGMENAHQTDIAKNACTGDWLFYIQADEVVHEDDLPIIKNKCERYLNDEEVEGMLFDYYHFFGDYEHYHKSHGWYKKEIRIIRNREDIHSWRTAQSFRRIPNFDGLNYKQKQGTYKLKVVPANARIFHYGWVRPPHLMNKKRKALDNIHSKKFNKGNESFNYGPLNKLHKFKGTHPAVMKEWIEKFNWRDQLYYSGKYPKTRARLKHEKPKYKILSWIENNLLGGKTIGGSKNYILLKKP